MASPQSSPALGVPFDRLPRQTLAFLPTPIHRLPKLSESLGVELWVKRDDMTGLALGGNKARKLEFLIGDALSRGADVVITTGGTQSNHARMTAAACRLAGLDCYLALDRGRHPQSGNLLLDYMLRAEIELIDDPDPAVAAARMLVVADEMRAAGRNPYVIPRGGSVPQGAVGYAAMVVELERQLQELNFSPNLVYVATGSCGTHAGVMAGRALVAASWNVRGISVSRSRQLQETKVMSLANELLEWLDSDLVVVPDHVEVDDRFAGPAYGVPTDATWEAVTLLMREESLVLDPVYTGKAMAGLLAQVREGTVSKGSKLVFVHTGGSPALFAYADEVPVTAGPL